MQNNLRLHIIQGESLLPYQEEAVVCPCDQFLTGSGFPMSQSVMRIGASAFTNDRAQKVQAHDSAGSGFPAGTVITMNRTAEISAAKIVMAVMPHDGSLNERQEIIAKIYTEIFHQANLHKITSVTMPALGRPQSKSSPDTASLPVLSVIEELKDAVTALLEVSASSHQSVDMIRVIVAKHYDFEMFVDELSHHRFSTQENLELKFISPVTM